MIVQWFLCCSFEDIKMFIVGLWQQAINSTDDEKVPLGPTVTWANNQLN